MRTEPNSANYLWLMKQVWNSKKYQHGFTPHQQPPLVSEDMLEDDIGRHAQIGTALAKYLV